MEYIPYNPVHAIGKRKFRNKEGKPVNRNVSMWLLAGLAAGFGLAQGLRLATRALRNRQNNKNRTLPPYQTVYHTLFGTAMDVPDHPTRPFKFLRTNHTLAGRSAKRRMK